MRRIDAREQVLDIWLRWNERLNEAAIDIAEGTVLNHFWQYLQAKHPHVVDFSSYNPYREVCAWITEDALP